MPIKRARSPPAPLHSDYENMSVKEVEERFGEITRLPLTRFQKLFGQTPVPDPDALHAAKRQLYKDDFHLARLESERNSARQKASEPKAAEPLFNYAEHYGKSVAEAKQPRPKGYPPFPITPEDIIDAKKQVQHIEMNYPRYDYVVYSNALTAARRHLDKLQRQFEEQERKYPGAYKYPHYNTDSIYALPAPPLPPSKMSSYPRHSGGKSKRVKRVKRSKRSKTRKNRVHKRRN